MNDTQISTELTRHQVRPSIQRIQIYRFLDKNRIHPTVDEIFIKIHKIIQTLSRMTVYNTVNLFAEKGILHPVIIEDNELRYDIDTTFHGHFKCEQCGMVSDIFNIKDPLLAADLAGHIIRHKHLYYIGTCKKCSVITKTL